ncbi:L-lysine 2-3-aminomutase, partial [Penicillium crustosum]|uniref:L-lysine 2-3-aminomutase n=1 Tax=Penicillium crustosum TaxID=36656 RepID=UPI00239CA563
VWKIGLPVRSAVLKPHAGELVVGWVTTSESSLLSKMRDATAVIVNGFNVNVFGSIRTKPFPKIENHKPP